MGDGGTLPGRSAHKNDCKKHLTANRQTAGRHADSTAHGIRRDASRTFGAQERQQKAPHGESANRRTTCGQHSAWGYGGTLPGRSARKNGSKRHPTANRQTAGRHADSTAHGIRRDASRTFGAQERQQKAPHGESANRRTTCGQHSAWGYGGTLPGRSARKNGSKRHPTANRQTAGRHAGSTAHWDTARRFPDVRHVGRSSGTDTISRKDPDGPNG